MTRAEALAKLLTEDELAVLCDGVMHHQQSWEDMNDDHWGGGDPRVAPLSRDLSAALSKVRQGGFTLIELAVCVLIVAIGVAITYGFLHPKPAKDGPPDGSGWTEVPSPDGSTQYQRSYRDGNERACVDRYVKTAQGVAISTDCEDAKNG